MALLWFVVLSWERVASRKSSARLIPSAHPCLSRAALLFPFAQHRSVCKEAAARKLAVLLLAKCKARLRVAYTGRWWPLVVEQRAAEAAAAHARAMSFRAGAAKTARMLALSETRRGAEAMRRWCYAKVQLDKAEQVKKLTAMRAAAGLTWLTRITTNAFDRASMRRLAYEERHGGHLTVTS